MLTPDLIYTNKVSVVGYYHTQLSLKPRTETMLMLEIQGKGVSNLQLKYFAQFQ